MSTFAKPTFVLNNSICVLSCTVHSFFPYKVMLTVIHVRMLTRELLPHMSDTKVSLRGKQFEVKGRNKAVLNYSINEYEKYFSRFSTMIVSLIKEKNLTNECSSC